LCENAGNQKQSHTNIFVRIAMYMFGKYRKTIDVFKTAFKKRDMSRIYLHKLFLKPIFFILNPELP
jgi:hypothetical protein